MKECCDQCRGTGKDYDVSLDTMATCYVCGGKGSVYRAADYRRESVKLREDVINAALKAGDYADAVHRFLFQDRETNDREAMARASRGLEKALMEIKVAQQEIHEYLYPQRADGDESELSF